MNLIQIETNIQNLLADFSKDSFIYEFLLTYGLPKASITRLKKGNLNLAKKEGIISWKKKLYFEMIESGDLHLTISDMAKTITEDERFVIISNWDLFLAIDTKTDEKLDIPLEELPRHYDFFLPRAGMEKAEYQGENPADVKAAKLMARLFDEIRKNTLGNSSDENHNLNMFLSRLLFCRRYRDF